MSDTTNDRTCTAVGAGSWLDGTDRRCELPLGHDGNEHQKGAVKWQGSVNADNVDYLHDLLYQAWGVIANAGLHNRGWESEHPEWVEAAERWRDEWHVVLHSRHTPADA